MAEAGPRAAGEVQQYGRVGFEEYVPARFSLFRGDPATFLLSKVIHVCFQFPQ